MTRREVSVVVPYYERQDQLDLLLQGLDHQSLPSKNFEVVVADDGSRRPPALSHRRYRTLVVRQPDLGFRLAQARNLGAAAASGRVLAFLDQDCIPAPDYLQRVAETMGTPWSLVVGHRLHTDLTGWPQTAVLAWLTADGPAPPMLVEPGWLLDGYRRTSNLTEPDDRAYQLVLGAALSLHRDLFGRLGGFDPTFDAYGGEDWDLGHRAYVAGADLRWLSDAVVWHDGPDLAGRPVDLVGTKNAETMALAGRIPDPDVRGTHLVWRFPRIVVRLSAGDATTAMLVLAVESLLAGADAHIWLDNQHAAAQLRAVLDDPRLHVGEPPPEVMARCGYEVTCDAVTLRSGALHDLETTTPVEQPGFRMVRVRDQNRHRRGVPWPRTPSWSERVVIQQPGRTPELENDWRARRLEADRLRHGGRA